MRGEVVRMRRIYESTYLKLKIIMTGRSAMEYTYSMSYGGGGGLLSINCMPLKTGGVILHPIFPPKPLLYKQPI